jgi:hypothetical protein
MTTLADVAAVLTGGWESACEAGHPYHDTVTVEIALDGPTLVPDFPSVPHGFASRWTMEVWDSPTYQGQIGVYCTGQDETSLSLSTQGVWEGFETVLALELLSTPGAVIDIGAQVGWYTMLAAVNGHPVLAVEADIQNLDLLWRNVERMGLTDLVVPCRAWIDVDTPDVTDSPQVRLLKADIEGLEREAVRVVEPLLLRQRIDWLMLELTPSFPGADVGGVVDNLNEVGYDTFLVPTKGHPLTPRGSVLDATLRSPLSPSAALSLPEQRTLLAGVLQ